MNGPFLIERGTAHQPFKSLTFPTTHDELSRALVLAGLVTLRGHAPRRYRMTATGGTPFTTTMRVVDRVHGRTANRRTDTPPSISAGFTERAQRMLGIAHFADRGLTVSQYAAHLTGAQAKRCVCTFARH